MKKQNAVVIALLLMCLAYVVVVALTERVSWDTTVPPGREQRAALALRDNVTPFQKWGSKISTVQYLNRYYDAAWYFTQSRADDQEKAFLTCLDKALERYPQVDLFLLAHSNKVIAWVAKLPVERRSRIRLVYNTGCWNLVQAPQWLALGAKAYVGHPGTSASSVFYFYFLRRWTRGQCIQGALVESNDLMRRQFRRGARFSLGWWNAAKLMQHSEARCYGDRSLRLEDCRK